MTAHQRLIRDRKAASDLRAPLSSLRGYAVELVTRDEALPVIVEYEWLGTPGNARIFVGLRAPHGELHGVAAFGRGPAPGGDMERLLGASALCLERGACIHYAPPNAASFLINRACKLVYRTHGIAVFYAYADPRAGEYGAVYQAAGWVYLGQGLQGARGDRKMRVFYLAPGADPAVHANWRTSRHVLRSQQKGGRVMTNDEACALGWTIEKFPAKHVYATNVGADRVAWRAGFPARAYPDGGAPELKRRRPG